MNNIISSLAILVLLLTGCQSVKIDVKQDTQTQKTENWEVNITKSILSSANPEAMSACTAVNEHVTHLLDSLQNTLRSEADTFFTTYAQTGDERPAFFYQLFTTDSVFMATDRYISLRTTVYTYEGGAHGRTNFYMVNYDVRAHKFLTTCEIVNCNKSDEINPLLEQHFNNENGCFTEKPTLTTQGFAGINISATDLCFTYEHYALGAYACGYAQIAIPRKSLSGLINIR